MNQCEKIPMFDAATSPPMDPSTGQQYTPSLSKWNAAKGRICQSEQSDRGAELRDSGRP